MGLSFLNKKSWHPGTFKSMAEVWEAEEKQRELEKHWEDIKKKRIEEKYSEELKKMQVEAGILPESALNSMEWMYPTLSGQDVKNDTEEYLLGKPVEVGKPELGLNQDKIRTFSGTTVNPFNEDFIKVREDPLYELRKEEMKRKEEIMNNPVVMQK